MSWPYCQATGCHDSHTRQYAWTGTWVGWNNHKLTAVAITAGHRDPIWGTRLCRAHALIRYGVR